MRGKEAEELEERRGKEDERRVEGERRRQEAGG